MKKIKIYLRSVEVDKKRRLALFDTNRSGAIDDLVTEAPPGSKVIWRSDSCSEIKTINRIYSKTGKGNIFKTEPRKRSLFNDMIFKIPVDAQGEEAYAIEYTLSNGEKLTVDPLIKIPPP